MVIIIIILRLTIRLNTTNITLCKSQFVGHLSFFFPEELAMPMVGPGGTVGLKMPGGMSTLGIEP